MIQKTDKFNLTPKEHFINNYNDTVDKIVFSGTFNTNKEEIILYNNDLTSFKEYLGNKIITGYTYSQLNILKNNNNLKVGYFYELKRRHKQSLIEYSLPDYLSPNIEVFLLEATAINSFNSKIISSSFETDLINYDFDQDTITYRIDTLNNIECNFDFRESITPIQTLSVTTDNDVWEMNKNIYFLNKIYLNNDDILVNFFSHLSTMTPNYVCLKKFNLLKDCKISYNTTLPFSVDINKNNDWLFYKTFYDITKVENVKIIKPNNLTFNKVVFINNNEVKNVNITNSNDIVFINSTVNNLTINNSSKINIFNLISSTTINNSNLLLTNNTINTTIENSNNLYFNDNNNNLVYNSSYLYFGQNGVNNKIFNTTYTLLNDNAQNNTLNAGSYLLGDNDIINNIFNNNFLYQNTFSKIFLGGNIKNNYFNTLTTNSYININNITNLENNDGYFYDNYIKTTDLNTPFFGFVTQIYKSMSGTTILNTSVITENTTVIHDSFITNNNRIFINGNLSYNNVNITGSYLGVGNITLTSSTVNNNYYVITSPVGNNLYALNVTTGGTYNGITKLL